MRQVYLTLGFPLALAACGGDGVSDLQTDLSRRFDELASALASCAGRLHACDGDDDAGVAECRDSFFECRDSAGEPVQEGLADAVAECRERADACRTDAAMDESDDCAQVLRACIGEARGRSSGGGGGAPRPNPNAPTYQCFGQLRECIAGTSTASQCAAAARDCVNAAIGDPPRARRPTKPVDAGMSERDASDPDPGEPAGSGGKPAAMGGRGGAGAGGDAGKAGAAGVFSVAGAGGSTMEPNRPDCMAKHDACLASGEKPMSCAKELRMCSKDER